MTWKQQIRTTGGRFGGLKQSVLNRRATSAVASQAKFELKLEAKAEELKMDAIYRRAKAGGYQSLSRSAFLIRRTAQSSIRTSRKPSAAGRPPHTKRGRIRKAIMYGVDRQRQEAAIGPAKHLTGTVGKAHEFGGKYKAETFKPRPFMGPALEAMRDQIPRQFEGMI